MSNRREFFTLAALSGACLGAVPKLSAADTVPATAADSRATWFRWLVQVSEPVLTALAENRLRATMPVESLPGNEAKREPFTHLEAVGRTLAGIAPWLGCQGLAGEEGVMQEKLRALTLIGLANLVNPSAADKLDFTAGPQNLVDAAFLALGLLRAPEALWKPLPEETKQRLIAALQSTRKFKPGRNNWLLFSATIESFLASVGAAWSPEPIDTALNAHEEWYQGDGTYGDGAEYHWDYYNSFVIQPMLLAVLDAISLVEAKWNPLRPKILKRAQRYAAVQERLIAADGSYPPFGRSITYRCGAFHHLATMALRQDLPASLTPAQVRCALAAVMQRTLGAAGTFDANGWLRIGLAGHQPGLAETYISTGSLYLCSCAFLPLGLPPAAAFWKDPATAWTAQKLWSGANLPADHSI